MAFLHEYCRTGDINSITRLVNNNNVNERTYTGSTPLSKACEHGHIEIVNVLINTVGFNSLNKKDGFGYTAFHIACLNDHVDIANLLLHTPGFNCLNKKNNDGLTPLMIACEYGYIEIIKLLLEQNDIIISKNIKFNPDKHDEIKLLIINKKLIK